MNKLRISCSAFVTKHTTSSTKTIRLFFVTIIHFSFFGLCGPDTDGSNSISGTMSPAPNDHLALRLPDAYFPKAVNFWEKRFRLASAGAEESAFSVLLRKRNKKFVACS